MTQSNTARPTLEGCAPIELDEAIQHASAIVAEVGDEFRYGDDEGIDLLNPSGGECMYVRDERPSCMVARILHRHGVPLNVLSTYEEVTAKYMSAAWPSPTSSPEWKSRLNQLPILATPDAAGFLELIQYAQDSREEWRAALNSAVEIVQGTSTTRQEGN